MKSIKPAVRRRGRNVSLLLLSLLFLPVSLRSEAAFAASLTVKVGQINPAGAVQQVTCTENKRCEVPVDIQTAQGTKETLTAYLSFALQGTVLLEFKGPAGYLYTGDKNPADPQTAMYETIWHGAFDTSKIVTFNTTLFLPAVPNSIVAPFLSKPGDAVGDLQITVEAAP